MTPFGKRMRELRAERHVTLRQMADAVGVSAAYLSALEHGKRGRPGWSLIQRIITYFNIIWDDAEEVAQLARVPSADQHRHGRPRALCHRVRQPPR
jgi:transcriptional regulator with XRE-family HTH domain